MRHLKAHRKLGRTTEHRMSMLRNLATSLDKFGKEHIVTTVPKAKELRPFVEKAITLARKAQGLEGDDAAAREVHLAARRPDFSTPATDLQGRAEPFRGAKGEAKDPIERTAGVKAVQRLFDELGTVTKTATAATLASSDSDAVRATMPSWP
jgi:ribosomal protein L17